MYRWFIAYRYLVSRIISFSALVVIAASVALLIIIVSVMEGFRSELQRRIRGTSSDIRVDTSRYIGLRNPRNVADILTNVEGVESTTPYIETLVLYQRDDGRGGQRECFLRVVDMERPAPAAKLARYVEQAAKEPGLMPKGLPPLPADPHVLFSKEWSEKGVWTYNRPALPDDAELPPVLVGIQFAHIQWLRPGTRIRLTAFSPRTQLPVTRVFLVAGYFKTGLYDLDSQLIVMNWKVADDFLGLTLNDGVSVASGVRVTALPEWRSPERLKELRGSVEKLVADAEVPFARAQTWHEEKASLLNAVKVEKTLVTFILGIIVLFSGFMIFIILTVQVVEKTRDLGVLQSMGVTPTGIASLYFTIGATLCLAGTFIGGVYGIGFSLCVNTIQRIVKLLFGYEVFPQHIFYMDEIPVRFELYDICLIVVPTIIVSLAASLVPAYRAARKDPVVALRYE